MNKFPMIESKITDHVRVRSGFTLVEMLVAIALFTIAVTVGIGGFVNALRTQRQAAALISAGSNMSILLEQMAREVRTGYLFCHELNVNTPNNDGTRNDYCGCTVSNAGAGQPQVWTCRALDYYDADGGHVRYSLAGGQLLKSDSLASDTTAQPLTGSDVSVKYFDVMLFGNLDGDGWTPRVTISFGVAPSSTDAAIDADVLQFQTTVSARTIDCTLSGSC